MKTIISRTFLFVLLVSFLSKPCTAIIAPTDDNFKALKAVRGKKIKRYLPGIHLRIVYALPQNDKLIIIGMFRGASEDSIALGYGEKNMPVKKIALADIQSIQKLHKKGRKGWKVLMGLLVVLTIIGLSMINSLGAIFFLAGPVIALYTLIPYLIANFLADIISKKSRKKGWSFSAD